MRQESILAALLSASLIAGCAGRARAATGQLYREAVTTFGDPVKAFETHLSGYIGEASSKGQDNIGLYYRHDAGATPGCMEMVYKMKTAEHGRRGPDDFGSMWMSLRGPRAATQVTLDLTKWDSLTFKVRGRAALVEKPKRAPGCTLRVEVRDLHPTQPVNWWRNTGKFVRNGYEYCRTRPDLYGEAAWGLTACEGRYKESTTCGGARIAASAIPTTSRPDIPIVLCGEEAALSCRDARPRPGYAVDVSSDAARSFCP